MVFQVFGTMPQHFLLCHFASFSQHHARPNGLAQQLVGHAEDGRLGHLGHGVEHVLDFLRADLLATGLDDVVHPRDEVKVALLVGAKQVARVEDLLAGKRPGPQCAVGLLGIAQ